MSLAYRLIDWNRQKRLYDLTLVAGILAASVAAAGAGWVAQPNLTLESLIIRTSAVLAFTLLHVILAIGPLARLDRRFLPLLYNRRHLGVTCCLLGVVHGGFAMIQFHALGDEWPWVSLFTAYGRDYPGAAGGTWRWVGHVPFEPFGLAALLILGVLAATSHDFWLKNLGPVVWKTLHCGAYAAYGLLLLHVALGAFQSERSPVVAGCLAGGLLVLTTLHLAAARRESRLGPAGPSAASSSEAEFVDACGVADVAEGRGRVCSLDGERVAVWRHGGRLFATANACRHQGGPLGEGRIRDGCITCPWHGWNYQPEDGCSPPPFQEVIATHAVRIVGDRVLVRRQAHPLRARSAGAQAGREEAA